jgi:hypothetical protein
MIYEVDAFSLRFLALSADRKQGEYKRERRYKYL